MAKLTWFVVAIMGALACGPCAATEQKTGQPPRVQNNIVYARIGKRAMHLNLITPAGESAKPRKVVLWVHGGGWSGGSYMDDPGTAYGLAAAGFVVGSVEYRLSQEAKYPAQIHDCKAAIRFLRANARKYNIDPDHIGVWGGSAGGHLVALLGTTAGIKALDGEEGKYAKYSSRVQAVCDLFGPTDLTAPAADDVPAIVKPMVDGLLGGSPQEKAGLARLASPVEFASKDDAPMLILHGDKDPLVPMSHSDKLYTALKRVGVDVELVKVKNAGHGFGAAENDPSLAEIQKMIVSFFKRHLGS